MHRGLRRLLELYDSLRSRPLPIGERPAGIVVTHILTPEIEASFARLRREAAPYVDWRLYHSRWSLADLIAGTTDLPDAARMPDRLAQAAAEGRLHGGFLDLLILPAAFATGSRHVWVMEYDVDYSGHWRHFFRQFTNNSADLLTTGIARRPRSRKWYRWSHAKSPEGLAETDQVRAMFPLFRVSRPLLERYFAEQHTGRWGGHYEHLLPTIAHIGGFAIEDIGGAGEFTPRLRRRRNYLGPPKRPGGRPGTFLFRPSWPAYFHADPTAFARPHMLYHPVKVGIAEWERKKPGLTRDNRRTYMDITLEPWDESGLPLLRALNSPHQKRHLGGPESEEKLLDRHARYLGYDRPGETRMLRVVVSGANAGSIGYWESEWQGETVYETGWEILSDFQGQGVASAAATRLFAELQREARHRDLFAFPDPQNAASNALCRRLGFELVGVEPIEYPKGTVSPHNVWRLKLSDWSPPAS